jgi:hypothetical protein
VTVNYHCLWRAFCLALGLEPPPEADHHLDWERIDAWVTSLDAREFEIAGRLCGSMLPRPPG